MSYWAAAQLETRRERTALHFLGLNGFTTYCPQIRTECPARTGERVTWLFPGYAFVWIELQWHTARWAPGVIRLVSSGAQPAKVPLRVIEDLKARERDGFVVLPKARGLQRGDRVRIQQGPLVNQLGLYDGQVGTQRRVELPQRDVAAAQG
jgi:transcriptional antiterminator RfaH